MNRQESISKIKGKCKVLQLGWNSPLQQYWNHPTEQHRLAAKGVETCFAEKDLSIMADKLNASQQWIPMAKQAKHMPGFIRKSMAEERNSSSP